MKRVAAILLAAGRSRRMGAFKPLLRFGPQTVIESSVANLQAGGVHEIIVVVGHRGDEIREKLTAPGVTFAFNSDADTPMSASIAVGLGQVSEQFGAVLIAPADHPAIPGNTIKLIVSEWERGAALVQPEYEGRGGHPVLVDREYFDELIHLDSELGMRGFFAQHRAETRRLPVNSSFIARDLDTWEDYVALHQDVFGDPPPRF
ncbi:MAG TPA: nucleotidyltransferase family protein [Pyrinomonadaceae bacterium]|nr:nucleotidyltransferase family protein [Pyrinomonadaceae bacterium]